MKLYELNSAIEQILNAMDSYADENEGLVSEQLEKELEALELAKEEKLKNCYKAYRVLEAEMLSYEFEAKRLQTLKARAEKKLEGLKNYVAACLQGEKFKCYLGEFRFRTSETVELEVEPQELPERYRRVKTTVVADKTTLKKDIKEGAEVPGVYLMEHKRLQVR